MPGEPGRHGLGSSHTAPASSATATMAYSTMLAPTQIGSLMRSNSLNRDRIIISPHWPPAMIRLFLALRRFLQPRPAHASITNIVRAMIFLAGIHIFRPGRIVLQCRNGTNAVRTRLEHVQHRHVVLAYNALPHLIPAAHGTAALRAGRCCNSAVVGRSKRDSSIADKHVINAFSN